MANSKVLIEVIATSKGLKVVAKDTEKTVAATKKLGQEQKKTTQSTKNLNKEHAKNDKLNKSVYQSNLSAAKGFSKQKEMIGTGSSGLVAAYATLAANIFAATAAFGALRAAAQVNTLIEGFSVIARESGRSAMQLAEGLRDAAGGALSLEQALRASAIGLTSGFTVEQMKGLTIVAKNASIALGRNMADAIDRLFRGVAKLEPEILDELGILVRLDSAAEAYGAQIGKTGSKLSDFERRQAFLNATLAQGELKYGGIGEAVDPNPFDQLARAFSDLTREFLEFANRAIVPVAKLLADNTALMVGALVLFASTIVKTMFPALAELGRGAEKRALQQSRASERIVASVEREIAVRKKEILSSKVGGAKVQEFKQQVKINAANKDYGKVLKALRISETQRANNLRKYDGEALKRKKAELNEVRKLRKEVLALQRDEQKTSSAQQKASELRLRAGAERTLGGGLGRIGQSGSLEGFGTARRELEAYQKRLKVVARQQGGFLKGKDGKYSFTGFGAKAKFAFKSASGAVRLFGAALVNAIPLIGQIIFVLGLVIEGVARLIGKNREATKAQRQFAESSKTISKAFEELEERQSKVAELFQRIDLNASASAIAGKQLANELKLVAGALSEFQDNLGTLTDELEEGKTTTVLGRFFKNLGRGIADTFAGLGQGLKDIANSIGETFRNAFALSEEDQRDLLVEDAIRILEENNPIQTLIDEADRLKEPLKKAYAEAFGEGGVAGRLKELTETEQEVDDGTGKMVKRLLTVPEAMARVQKEVDNFTKGFKGSEAAVTAFDSGLAELNKNLVKFQDKQKNRNEFSVIAEEMEKVFDATELLANGIVTADDVLDLFNSTLTAQGVGALKAYGITADNALQLVDDGTGNLVRNIDILIGKFQDLAALQQNIDTLKRVSAAQITLQKQTESTTMAVDDFNDKFATFQATGKFEFTPQQSIERAKTLRDLAIETAQTEFESKLLIIQLETKLLLMKADINKEILNREKDGYDTFVSNVKELAELQEKSARKGFEAAAVGINTAFFQGQIAAGQSGSLVDRAQAVMGSGILTQDTVTTADETLPGGKEERNVTTQEKLQAMSGVLTPMMEQLNKLGPEGELVAAATSGIFGIASAFVAMGEAGDNSAKKLEIVGGIIGQIGAIMAASSKAQIAEIDQQIETEKKRDGKSKESLAKIEALEKKKVAMEKKAFERNKKVMMAQTIMNTAAGVMATMKDTGFFGSPLAMIVAAMGAAQLAIISKQKFQGGTGNVEKPAMTNLTIGKRSDAVDVSQRATGGELNYLRGGRTTGGNLGGAGGFLPGSAMGRKGYAMGFRRGYADGGIVVGERGPEIITPSTDVDIVPNFALGGGTTNVNFSINAIDAAGVEDVLMNQQGNIIRMIREAANENGERFLETVDTQTYGSRT